MHIGTLYVTNSPLQATASSSRGSNQTSASNESSVSLHLPNDIILVSESFEKPGSGGLSSNNTPLGIPEQFERRWLKCWTAFFLYAVKFSPLGPVLNDISGSHLHPRPGLASTFHFSCDTNSGAPTEDSLDVTMFAVDDPQLPWGQMMVGLLSWIAAVAADRTPWNVPVSVKSSSNQIVYSMVSIHLMTPPNDGAATA